MMLVARIRASDESNERVLELAARVVELDEIELGLDDRTADLRTAVLRGRERVQQAAALLVRIADLLHAVDDAEHLADRGARLLGLQLRVLRLLAAVRIAPLLRHADRHADLANLALVRGQLALAADAQDLAATEHQQPITGLADLGEDVARDQDRVVLLEVVDEVAHLDDLHRIETARGLVEDEELRLMNDRLRDTDAL